MWLTLMLFYVLSLSLVVVVTYCKAYKEAKRRWSFPPLMEIRQYLSAAGGRTIEEVVEHFKAQGYNIEDYSAHFAELALDNASMTPEGKLVLRGTPGVSNNLGVSVGRGRGGRGGWG